VVVDVDGLADRRGALALVGVASERIGAGRRDLDRPVASRHGRAAIALAVALAVAAVAGAAVVVARAVHGCDLDAAGAAPAGGVPELRGGQVLVVPRLRLARRLELIADQRRAVGESALEVVD